MKKIAGLMVFLLAIAMIGVTDATPSVDICLDSPPSGSATCASLGTIVVYQSVDASVSPGLHALYAGGWDSSATYDIKVTDIDANPDGVVFGPNSGLISSLTGGKAYYAWTPTKWGTGKYKVRAYGSQEGTPLEAEIIVKTSPNVVPELPTSALLAVGLIGLIGMVRFRRK